MLLQSPPDELAAAFSQPREGLCSTTVQVQQREQVHEIMYLYINVIPSIY